MKRNNLTSFAVIVVCLWQSAPGFAADKLAFDSYSGYFVSNKFEPNAPESFVIATDQGQFDNVFGVGFVMRDKSHRLAKDAFASNIVIAAVKRGNAPCDYTVEGVSVTDGVVEFKYKATVGNPGTATFASPLIVSIPKGEYKAIQFVENGKPVKELEIGK